jgi:hypothetical protein
MSMKRFVHRICLGAALALAAAGWLWAQDSGAGKPVPPGPGNGEADRPKAAGNISSADLTPKIFENWDTPSLEGSALKALPAMPLGGVDTVDGVYTHEVERLQWRPGDAVDVYVVKPVGVKNPPVVLYLYSFPFETDRFLDHAFCKFLVRSGVAAVLFPSALTGPRYNNRPMKEWFASEMRESLATTAHDVQMILNYLESRGDLDMKRVGMFGDGSGASIAILTAAVDERITSLDLLDPWGDWPDWVAKSTRIPENERANFLKQEWLDANAAIDPVKWFAKLKTPKVRLQMVKSVGVTPPAARAKIEAAAPPQAEIVHFENEDAFRAAVAQGTGFDWIQARVQGKAAATEEKKYDATQKAPAQSAPVPGKNPGQ